MAGNTPRVLRITFELHVRPDLGRNIAFSKVERAFDAIRRRVMDVVPAVFPWADEVRVRREWLYDWHDRWDKPEKIEPNEFNRPEEP